MKKLISLIGAGTLLLSVAGPAFASWNYAYVNNNSSAVATTGGNSQSNIASVDRASNSGAVAGSVGGDRTIYTGNADAYAGALVVANTHVNLCCERPDPCCNSVTLEGNCGGCGPEDVAYVNNGAGATAATGSNYQDNVATVSRARNSGANAGSSGGSSVIWSGDATSKARAWTVVNTHVGF